MLGIPALCALLPCVRSLHNCCEVKSIVACVELVLHFSAMDVLAWTTMKGAAKCDEHCELQNSVNQQVFERARRFWDIPGRMPASVSIGNFPVWAMCLRRCCMCQRVC